MAALLSKLKALKAKVLSPSSGSPEAKERASILRRKQLLARAEVVLPILRTLLIIAGFGYLLALPVIGRGHYVSENALQPSQVNTYWNWADVHIADQYDKDLKQWSILPSSERAKAIQDAFLALGISSSTQSYSFRFGGAGGPPLLNGTNSYAILQAPKTDGAEAVVVGASWRSRALDEGGERRINVRGVALVLALANYLKKYSMWSKDIIFLISDGYVDGAQAWVDEYHGFGQSNLDAESLSITTGPIWAALNIDYPHHSFSKVGMYYEGTNGQLPNLDFMNTVSHILKHSGITPVLHNASAAPSPDSFLETYKHAAGNLMLQVLLGAQGTAQGPEAVWGRYRVEALSLFGVPAEGPHGFHAIGRAVESTLRSLNNLLERFHQSFFLYLMKSVDTFIPVGSYLAAPILVCAGMTVKGLMIWGECALPLSSSSPPPSALSSGGKVVRLVRSRPVGAATATILVTHAVGGGLLAMLSRLDPVSPFPTYLPATLFLVLLFLPIVLSLVLVPASASPFTNLTTAPLSSVLKSLNLILGGLSIAVVATLNFGAAVILSFLLCLPLTLARPFPSSSAKEDALARIQQVVLAGLSPPVLWALFRILRKEEAESWLRELLTDWHVMGSMSLPFTCVVIVPLLLQAAVATLV